MSSFNMHDKEVHQFMQAKGFYTLLESSTTFHDTLRVIDEISLLHT